jgi:PAS domain-containing protein
MLRIVASFDLLIIDNKTGIIALNWLLRRIFGPRRDEVTGGWRKLHNEELHN